MPGPTWRISPQAERGEISVEIVPGLLAAGVFAILGVVMMTSGSTDYTQMSLVYYGTKADLVAPSRIQEVEEEIKILTTYLSAVAQAGRLADSSPSFESVTNVLAKKLP